MFRTPFLTGALFAMSTALAAPASAQSSGPSSSAAEHQALQLFVTLPIKPDHLERFLATMHREVAGARSEAGNLAFDVYQDIRHPNTLYLFEHWVNEAALDSHTEQPYYKAIRAQEADDLAGSVQERNLSEVSPVQAGRRVSDATGHPVLSVLRTEPSAGPKLLVLFGEVAEQMRAHSGNQTFALYQDQDQPATFLLIERWADSAARKAALEMPVGKRLLLSLRELTESPLEPIALVDRSH